MVIPGVRPFEVVGGGQGRGLTLGVGAEFMVIRGDPRCGQGREWHLAKGRGGY